MIRASKPGIIRSSSRKAENSLRSLKYEGHYAKPEDKVQKIVDLLCGKRFQVFTFVLAKHRNAIRK